MSSIEEITGRLKIMRSFSLVSLSFFRNLRKIGSKLSPSEARHSLHVVDNQNLQELFPSPNVTIVHGRLFFHFNPKLCYGLIEKMIPFTMDLVEQNVTRIPPEDVATNSNGDKVACEFCFNCEALLHKLWRQMMFNVCV